MIEPSASELRSRDRILKTAIQLFAKHGFEGCSVNPPKNAILLVDYLEQLRASGMPRDQAIIMAGVRRLRPIMIPR